MGDGMDHTEMIAEAEKAMLRSHEEAQSIQAQADADQRDLSPEEESRVQACQAQFKRSRGEIERRRELQNQAAAINAPQPRVVHSMTPVPTPGAISTTAPHAQRFEYVEGAKTAWGWRSFGEYVRGVINAGTGRGLDPRFQAAATTYGSEGTSADGGYALPPDFRDTINKKVQGEQNLMSLCEQYVTSSNKITVPLDTTTPWQTSGGVLVNWTDEGTAITNSKPSLAQIDIQAYKLAALVPLTDELIEDVPAINSWLPGKIGDKLVSALNLACIAGTGTGQPTGIVGSAGEVVVTPTSSVGKVTWAGVTALYSRMLPQLIPQAVWLIHPSVLPSLLDMTGAGSVPVWLPPGPATYSAGVAGPAGTLLGRPVLMSEYCSAVGTKGDIIFWAPKTCACVMKASGIRSDLSIHFYFDQAIQSLRVITRVGHKSLYTSAVSPKNGAATYGNVVDLSSTRT
jgi:HK97 family phage major capsid protein